MHQIFPPAPPQSQPKFKKPSQNWKPKVLKTNIKRISQNQRWFSKPHWDLFRPRFSFSRQLGVLKCNLPIGYVKCNLPIGCVKCKTWTWKKNPNKLKRNFYNILVVFFEKLYKLLQKEQIIICCFCYCWIFSPKPLNPSKCLSFETLEMILWKIPPLFLCICIMLQVKY